MGEETIVLNPGSLGGGSKNQKPYVEEGADLPQGYGLTSVVLLPRDPQWMYTYWEVTESTLSGVKSQHGDDVLYRSQPTIRMHQLQESNGTVKEIQWIDISVTLDAHSWYLHTDRAESSWFVELGLKLPDGQFIVLARSNIVRLPSGMVSNQIDEKWATFSSQLQEVFDASGGGKLGQGSLELARLLMQRWEFLNHVSSWMGSGGFSSASRPVWGAPEKRRGFWLVADCELVLYGATEPSASVTVCGKPIELAPDGTFSFRFALPDGKLELPVVAVSGDRVEERWIKIEVGRKTDSGDKILISEN